MDKDKCDVCETSLTTEYVDGATMLGPWANMCPACFSMYGRGIGTGRGQRYERVTINDKWQKTAG